MKGLLAIALAVVGSVLAGYGAFQAWQHGRVGAHIPLAEVVSAPSKATASPATSAFVLIVIGIALALFGLFRKKSGLIFVGGLLMLVPVALPVALSHVAVGDLQPGAWQVVIGGVLALGAAVMRS